MAALAAPPSGGMDWVAATRWMTTAYGAIAILGVVAYGLVFQYLNVPAQDPVTGRIVEETVNIRPLLLGVAFVLAPRLRPRAKPGCARDSALACLRRVNGVCAGHVTAAAAGSDGRPHLTLRHVR